MPLSTFHTSVRITSFCNVGMNMDVPAGGDTFELKVNVCC